MRLHLLDDDYIDIDKYSVMGGIFLLIPGLRAIGAIILFHKLHKKLRRHGVPSWLVVLAVLLAIGSIGEITGALINLAPVLTLLAGAGIAYFVINKKQEGRLPDYVSIIGDSACIELNDLAKVLGVSVSTVKHDIKKLRKKGMIADTAYIDESRNMLVVKPEGRQTSHEQNDSNESESQYDKILRSIRALNDEIEDETMSRKIDHIENTTAGIFRIVEQKPERVNEIQTFMEYYLPTTLKLLSDYARLERHIDGTENIIASKRKIEGVMDKVVEGFDEQLNRLFKSEAIDISNDVKVLEKMMKMDGLGGH